MENIFLLRSVLILCMLTLFTNANAQRIFFGFVHGEYAKPTNDDFKYGLGIEAGAGVGLGKNFLVGTVGYTWLNSKATGATNIRYSPYKLGLRRYVLRKNVFVKADAGLAGIKFPEASSTTRFTADVGFGVKLTAMETTAEYTTVTGGGVGGWFSLKAGFTLGL
jgi:hypothetical protein